MLEHYIFKLENLFDIQGVAKLLLENETINARSISLAV